MDKILLIDGMNAIHRANVAFNQSKVKPDPNDPTFDEQQKYIVIFNFFRNLRPLVEQFTPHKIFFVLEGHPKFRYDLFADYKANRIIKTGNKQEALDKLYESKDEILRLLAHFPITLARAANYECDDVISSLCESMRDENLTVISNDSDYIQLLQNGYKRLNIFNPIKKEFMVAPTYSYVAWKCLVGDKSDNIPGFSMIGDKRAKIMLSDPDEFQRFLYLEENRANFNIYRQLIQFGEVPPDEILFQEGVKNFSIIKEEFSKMKFESIVNDKSWNKFVKTFNCVKY